MNYRTGTAAAAAARTATREEDQQRVAALLGALHRRQQGGVLRQAGAVLAGRIDGDVRQAGGQQRHGGQALPAASGVGGQMG